MPVVFLNNTQVTEKNLVEFDLFTIQDNNKVKDLTPLSDLECSDELIANLTTHIKWTGYTIKDADTVSTIGYNNTSLDNLNGPGMLESESYSKWIANLKLKEKKIKKLIPIPTISQSQYDALLSLYYWTGTISYIGSDYNRVNIYEYIKERKWNYIATALILTNNQRHIRQIEASILMLADYGRQSSRQSIRNQGIQNIRKNHQTMDSQQKQQAEYIYYVETSRFLPNLSLSRQRQLVNQKKTNSN
jgi:GH24 family phage-related lysozyme (muramidase)